MQLSLFGYLVFAIALGAVVTAVGCGIVAYRRKKLFATDIGTILLPFVAFYCVGFLRPEFRIGLGLFLGPLITLILSAYAFGLRIAVIDRLVENTKVSSRILFGLCVTAAIFVAATMAPWYE